MHLPFIHGLEELQNKITGKAGIRFEPWPIFILGIAVICLGFIAMPKSFATAGSLSLFFAPLWLSYLLLNEAWSGWIIWRRSQFIASQKYILLELRPPRNLVKTPLAMEAFLSTLHITGGESTWYARLLGGVRPNFSLEIASFEGRVHFFIWTRASFRRMIESQLYAQYPELQIREAVDYTRTISAKDEEWIVWGCDFKHTSPDAPLPIKTYVEYGLDKVQKEVEQVDPLSNLVEFMASIGKGEYLWLQYIIRTHNGERYGSTPAGIASTRLNKKGKAYTWRDEAEELIEKIRKETRGAYKDDEGVERYAFPNPTKGEAEKMAAIDRNVSKLAFDVGIRGIYLSRKENFNAATIGHLIALYKPFTNVGWNGLNSQKWMKTFDDYPWERSEKRKAHYRREMVEAYRRRQFFYDPFFEGGLSSKDTPIMSTEELATVFHIPSQSIASPGLERSTSATNDAPANLPV
jgi:hypothetical protein